MKKLLALGLLALVALSAMAQTGTVQWSLRNAGSTAELGSYTTQAACDTAAKARNMSASYECPRLLKVTAACPAQPAAESQAVACPAGTTGSWAQTRTYAAAAAPTCWVAGAWMPSAAPAGACTAVVVTPPPAPSGTALQMSPAGSDSGDCTATPCLTFAYAFSKLATGGELILQDGTYTSAMSWTGPAGSAQIPSGTASAPTYVHAANPGKAIVPGLFIGRSTRKDSYIKVQGITFEGDAALYNTSFVTLKEIGVHGMLDVGTGDHTQGNTDNLIEDAWVWVAEQRIIAINYRADRNVWRRVVIRGDGCYAGDCLNSGAPNVGITVYESRDVSFQNVIVVDRVLSPAAIAAGNSYADFATAQHTADASLYLGRNEWLGCMSINGPDSGFQFEADVTIPGAPTWTLRDVAVIGRGEGINLGYTGRSVLANALTVNPTQQGDGIRVAPGAPGDSVSGVIVKGYNRGLNSSLAAATADVFGSALLFNQTTPTAARTSDPLADGSIKYPVRVEAASPLAAAGYTLDITKRIGADGSRYGDAGYNAATSAALWPWPNEARIKAEMCASVTRGFCAARSLSAYVWEQFGNTAPF